MRGGGVVLIRRRRLDVDRFLGFFGGGGLVRW